MVSTRAKPSTPLPNSIREINAQIREYSLENQGLRAKVRKLECQLSTMAEIKNINREEADRIFVAQQNASNSAEIDELRARANLAEEKLRHSRKLDANRETADHIRKLELRILELEELQRSTTESVVPDHCVTVVSQDDSDDGNDLSAQGLAQAKRSDVGNIDAAHYLATIARLETELSLAERRIQEQKDELIAWKVASLSGLQYEQNIEGGAAASAAGVESYQNVHRGAASSRSPLSSRPNMPQDGGSRLDALQNYFYLTSAPKYSYAHGAAPPVLSSGDETMHSGYMLKCSRLVKKWQRRFFVFYKQEGVLNYFGTEGGARKGAVSLRHQGTQVERAEDVLRIVSDAQRMLPRNVHKSPALHLRVATPATAETRARVMWLAATCHEDRERWMQALHG
eukprot:g5204.t1